MRAANASRKHHGPIEQRRPSSPAALARLVPIADVGLVANDPIGGAILSRTRFVPRDLKLPEHTRLLWSEKQIAQRVSKVADQIERHHQDEKLLLVGLLNGAVPFLSDLARELGRRGLDVDYELIRASSYGQDNQQAETVKVEGIERVLKKADGKRLILVDDLVDTGRTLAAVKGMLGEHAAQAKLATLLFKPTRLDPERGTRPDYFGEAIPDLWVLGYGMDHFGGARQLPVVAYYVPPKKEIA